MTKLYNKQPFQRAMSHCHLSKERQGPTSILGCVLSLPAASAAQAGRCVCVM